jgi:hypothetical protein
MRQCLKTDVEITFISTWPGNQWSSLVTIDIRGYALKSRAAEEVGSWLQVRVVFRNEDW